MNRKQSFHHLQDMIILNGTDAIVRLRGPSRSPVMDQLTASALARMKAKTRRCFFAAFKSLSTRVVRCPNNFRFHVLQNDFALICCRRTSRKLSQRARKAKCTRCSRIPQLRLCSLRLEKKQPASLKLATPGSWPTLSCIFHPSSGLYKLCEKIQK